MAATCVDLVQELVSGHLVVFAGAVVKHQLREAEDRVERRSKLVAHVGQELTLVPVRDLEFVVEVFDRILGPLPRGDIPHKGDEPRLVVHPRSSRDRQLHRKFTARPIQRGKLQDLAQHRGVSPGQVSSEAGSMCLAVRVGNDRIGQNLAQNLVSSPAERYFRLWIPV